MKNGHIKDIKWKPKFQLTRKYDLLDPNTWWYGYWIKTHTMHKNI